MLLLAGSQVLHVIFNLLDELLEVTCIEEVSNVFEHEDLILQDIALLVQVFGQAQYVGVVVQLERRSHEFVLSHFQNH